MATKELVREHAKAAVRDAAPSGHHDEARAHCGRRGEGACCGHGDECARDPGQTGDAACAHHGGHGGGHVHACAKGANACGHVPDHAHAHDHAHGTGHDGGDRLCCQGRHHGDGASCACDGDCHEDGCGASAHEAPHALMGVPTYAWQVTGLDCPHCAWELQEAVASVDGVFEARLVYATATLEVVVADGGDEASVRRDVLEMVRSMGYDLVLSGAEAAELGMASWWHRRRESVLMGASGMALVAGLIVEHALGSEPVAIPLYVAAAVLGLVFIAPMALAALRRRTADMNVLMGVAVIGSLVLGAAGDTSTFADAAIVIFLDQVGEWLEGWSMRKTSGSIRSLMELAPNVAHVVDASGAMVETDVANVAVGATVRILAGERVALDGTIIAGASAFNEAAITGESVPADKGVGEPVYAGALNTTGVVDVRVTAPATASTLARVVEQVQGAQAQKAPYESFVDRFAAVYTPLVVVAAGVVGLVVPLALSIAFGATASLWHDWAYRALSLLVVACPCALVISTPVSFVSAITRAARDGMLVKGGGVFDVAAHLTCVAIDKTGTLTKGLPAVTTVVALSGAADADVLRVAAALEGSSAHPLGRAITDAALSRGIGAPVATGVSETVAAGADGHVDGVACAIGKPSFAATFAPLNASANAAIASVANAGATALVVVRGGVAIGVIGVADTLRAEAAQAVARLHGQGIATTMLTGDHAASAAVVAQAAGVSDFAADLLPEGKVAAVRALQGTRVVAMVGDGINDAPALAAADMGVTMGAASSDTALEVADVALLGDDLAALPALVALSRRVMRVVRENIVFAIVVKAAVFVAVIAGVAGMGAAVFADTGVSVLVILNGMRLMVGRARAE